jgi:hypothetical protein
MAISDRGRQSRNRRLRTNSGPSGGLELEDSRDVVSDAAFDQVADPTQTMSSSHAYCVAQVSNEIGIQVSDLADRPTDRAVRHVVDAVPLAGGAAPSLIRIRRNQLRSTSVM